MSSRSLRRNLAKIRIMAMEPTEITEKLIKTWYQLVNNSDSDICCESKNINADIISAATPMGSKKNEKRNTSMMISNKPIISQNFGSNKK